jgi:hypothetical protein
MKKLSEIVNEGYFKSLDTERQEKARLAKMDKKKTTSNSSEYKKKTTAPARSLSRMESTDAYKKTMDALRDKKKKDAISTSDKQKLGAVAALMKRANEQNEIEEVKVPANYAQMMAKKKKKDAISTSDKHNEYNVSVKGEGGVRVKAKTPKHAASKAFQKLGVAQRHRSNIKHTVTPHKEEVQVDEYITGKQIRMAKGIANDPRHKGGDMTGASKKMEKIKKGLSNHPAVAKALRTANEERESILSFMEVAGQRGRPKRGESGESDQHIIMQLRSAQDLGGNRDIKFSNQKSAKVHPTHIDKILKAHDTLKMPRDKRRLRVAIGRSHEHLKRVADALK